MGKIKALFITYVDILQFLIFTYDDFLGVHKVALKLIFSFPRFNYLLHTYLINMFEQYLILNALITYARRIFHLRMIHTFSNTNAEIMIHILYMV